MSFHADTSDLRAHLKSAEAAIVDATKVSLAVAGRVAWENAVGTTLYKDRTGNLRRKTGLAEGRGEFSIALVARTKYASFVNAGTNSHVIFANKAKMLRFQVGGAWRSAIAVHHPGTKPRPFMDVAAKSGEQCLLSELEHAAARACAG